MRRRYKIGLSVLAALVAIPLLTTLLLTVFFQSAIKERFEVYLNNQLSSTVVLNGSASFSFFRYFPQAAISFEDVTILGSSGMPSDTLLQAGRVAMLFNPFAIYNGSYAVETVRINNGFVRLQEDGNGNNNYTIWSTAPSDEAAEQSVSVALAEALLKDMHVSYNNARHNLSAALSVDRLSLSAVGEADNYTLALGLEGQVAHWHQDGEVYLTEVPLALSTRATLALGSQMYQIDTAAITIAGDNYRAVGTIRAIGNAWSTNVQLAGDEVSVQSLIALLPPNTKAALSGWESEGSLQFSSRISGSYSPSSFPGIAIDFNLEDGLLRHPALKKAITAVHLTGHFTNGERQLPATSSLVIKDFRGKMGLDPLQFTLLLEDFDDPIVQLTANASVDVSWWSGFLGPLGWSTPAGRIALEDIVVNGSIKDWQSGRYPHRTKAAGVVTVAGLSGDWQGTSWEMPVGQVALDQQKLVWEDVVLHAGNSDVTTAGVCRNFWSYLTRTAQGDSTAVVEVEATFTGEQLDWADVAAFIPASSTTDLSPANYLPYFQQFHGGLGVDFRRFTVASFMATQLKGEMEWSPYLSKIEELTLTTAQGQLSGSGLLRVLNNQLVLEGRIIGEDVAIDKVFHSFDNFWQDFIVAENLKGSVDGQVDVVVAWDPDLSFAADATDISAQLTVKEGELVDFAPMEALSDFVKLKELKRITFSALKNDIRVEGTTVILPAMQITSTAMNLWISGTHTFENEIDYQLQIDLLDVIARKVKLGKMKLEQAEQRQDGLLNMYVTMTGTVDEPIFTTDKAAVLSSFEASRRLLDPAFIDFNGASGAIQQTPFVPKEVQDQQLDYIDW